MLQIIHIMKSSIEYITNISVNLPELNFSFFYVILFSYSGSHDSCVKNEIRESRLSR